jgi:hypothetical protein
MTARDLHERHGNEELRRRALTRAHSHLPSRTMTFFSFLWNAAERQAQLRQRPQRLRLQDPAPLRAGPGSGGTTPRSGQPDNEIIFLQEDDEDDANETSPTIQFISPKGETNEA